MSVVGAEVIRENLVKIEAIPLFARVNSLPGLEPGAKVELKISDIDLLDATFHAEYTRRTSPDPR